MRRSAHLRIRHFMYDRRNDDWTHRPIRPIDTNRKQIIMQLKNNDSFLRASLSCSFSFSPHSPSLYICFSRSLSRLSPIKNFKCRFLPLDRSVCPILLTDVLPSLFGSGRFTSTILACLSLTPSELPLSQPLWFSRLASIRSLELD